MPIDARLLTLTQWLSASFPIGAFAYSHGLERAVADGWITDAAQLRDWLEDCLRVGSGRADAIWLRLALDDPLAANADARAFAASAERLSEAAQQGAAFSRTVNEVWGLQVPDNLLLPVAVGAAVGQARLDPDVATALYLQAFASNLVQAAMRLMLLGQSDAQAVLAALQTACIEIADDTRDATRDDVFSNAFLSDIAAMRHETQQPRIFQS